MATTEVKRFWMAPRSARVLLIELRALSTISRACWAPLTLSILTSLSSWPVAPVVAVGAAEVKPVTPALTPAVTLMALKLPFLSTLSFTDVRLILPAAPSISA
ncbi:hypothetical protein D3C81_1496470 [compost metagenome]